MAITGSFSGTTSNAKIKPTIYWSYTQDIATNSSTVTATLKYSRTNTGYTTKGSDGSFSITINGDKKSVSSKAMTITYNSNTEAISHTVVVPHNADGTKTITISATGGITGTSFTKTTISGNITLQQISRPSTLNVSDGVLGTQQTLTITQLDSRFTDKIKITCGESTESIEEELTNTSFSFTPPIEWAAQNTTGSSVPVTYTITTSYENTEIGSNTYTKTCAIPDSVKIDIGSVTAASTITEGVFSGYYIQGKSRASIIVTSDTTNAQGATVKSCKATIDGKTYDFELKEETDNSWVGTTDILTGSGYKSIEVELTDSRGRVSTASTASSLIFVYSYAAPSITGAEAKRDEDGNLVVEFTASAIDINEKNKIADKEVKYKKVGETEDKFLLIDSPNSEGKYIIENAAADSAYNIRITVADTVGETKTVDIIGSALTVFMSRRPGGKGLALNKLAVNDGEFDVGFVTRFSGGYVAETVASDADFNEILKPGWYSGTISSNLNNPVNEVGVYFSLEVIDMGEGRLMQRFETNDTAAPLIYTRQCTAEKNEDETYTRTWGDWIRRPLFFVQDAEPTNWNSGDIWIQIPTITQES